MQCSSITCSRLTDTGAAKGKTGIVRGKGDSGKGDREILIMQCTINNKYIQKYPQSYCNSKGYINYKGVDVSQHGHRDASVLTRSIGCGDLVG